MHPKPNHIDHTPEEEVFLRRIGGAVIVHWDQLPNDMKDLLVQQAADMADKQGIVQGDYQIREFIEAHKGGDG